MGVRKLMEDSQQEVMEMVPELSKNYISSFKRTLVGFDRDRSQANLSSFNWL